MCAQQTTCRLNGERGEREAEGKTGFRGLSPAEGPRREQWSRATRWRDLCDQRPDGHGADGVKVRAQASEDGVSEGQARKAQFVEYR